jgi:DNA-binding response OmpR family regulator
LSDTGRSDTLVLIADDDADVLDLVRYRLDQGGYGTITAVNGAEALMLARERLPDLCVLDVMMPKLSGVEVLQELRRDPDLARLPVILLTARGHDADLDAGFDAGANDYVTKPFSPSELRQRVRQQLSD